jgi:hypothetical protein
LGPGLITKKITSTHIGFEQNQYVKKGSGQQPFRKASLPERFEKARLGLIGARADHQKAHIGTAPFLTEPVCGKRAPVRNPFGKHRCRNDSKIVVSYWLGSRPITKKTDIGFYQNRQL